MMTPRTVVQKAEDAVTFLEPSTVLLSAPSTAPASEMSCDQGRSGVNRRTGVRLGMLLKQFATRNFCSSLQSRKKFVGVLKQHISHRSCELASRAHPHPCLIGTSARAGSFASRPRAGRGCERKAMGRRTRLLEAPWLCPNL